MREPKQGAARISFTHVELEINWKTANICTDAHFMAFASSSLIKKQLA
jgi:hypothetical protein